jgi:hypothetical protein
MRTLKPRNFIVLLLLAASLAFAAPATDLPFGDWKRSSKEPILSPQGTGWESAGVFNPAVVSFESPFWLLHGTKVVTRRTVMLYRAQDAAGTSRIGYAESEGAGSGIRGRS